MSINKDFEKIFNQVIDEQGIKIALLDIAKINKNDIKTVTDNYHEYLKSISFETHFEHIYTKIPLQSSRELYLKKLAKIFDLGIKPVKSDYEDFKTKKEYKKKQEESQRFPLLLEKTFKLDYVPYISRVYDESFNFITFNTDKEITKLCNIFVPQSIITSEINGKRKTHIRISINHKNKVFDIIESIRDFNKSDRLANIFGDNGFFVDSPTASKISTYLSDYMKHNQLQVKEEIGRLQTGWKNGVFYLPQRKQDVVWLEPDIKKAYIQNGKSENQLILLKELAKGKVFINVLGAFASCLFGIVNPMNFFIHNGGLTEGGKSLAVKCALSFFGKPSRMGNNWNATLNGLETYWEQNHSQPTWIDEMEVANRVEDIIKAVYAFTDERGRLRAFAKDDEVKKRETKEFKGICFTTGEKSFSEVQNLAKDRVKPRGITRRVIDLNIKDLWKNVSIDKVKPLLDNNYGILGVEFIEYLENNRKAIKDDFENQKNFFTNLDGAKSDQFGLLKLTLELMKQIGFLNQYEYDIQVANLKYFATSEKENIDIIKDTYTEFKETYTEFIMSNREHFDFVSSWSVEDENLHTKTPFYGKVDLDKNIISIFRKEFQDWCSDNNFVKNQVLEVLEDNENLALAKGRERYRDKVVAFGKTRIRCYQFVNLFNDESAMIYESFKPDRQVTEDVQPEPKKDFIQDENLFDNNMILPIENQKVEFNNDELKEEDIPF